MMWDFPPAPECSRERREVYVHVAPADGEVLELPVTGRWTADEIITTLAEIQAL